MRCLAFLPGLGWAPGRDLDAINCNKGAEANMSQELISWEYRGIFLPLKNKDLTIKEQYMYIAEN